MRIFLLLFLFVANFTYAANNDIQNLKKIENYLNNITTLTANFDQITSDGKKSTGKLYLQRPSKMKWEYYEPSNIEILLSDNKVTYYDKDLDELTISKIESNIFNFFIKKQIKLDFKNYQIEIVDNNFVLNFTEYQNDEQVSVKLVFSKDPISLKAIEIKDFQDETIRILLSNAIYSSTIEKNKFQISRQFLKR